MRVCPSLGCGLASLGLGTGALLLCALLLNMASWLSPCTSVRFQDVPWGNFDLERMRVTDLAAAQGPAVSLRPGLGCPCCLPTPGMPGYCSGLRAHRRGLSSLHSVPRSVHFCPVTGLCAPLSSSNPFIHDCGGQEDEQGRVLPFQEPPALHPKQESLHKTHISCLLEDGDRTGKRDVFQRARQGGEGR